MSSPLQPRRVAAGRLLLVLALAAGVAGCQRNPLMVKRSPCPAVAVPTYLGDATIFGAGGSADARNIDMVATITNVRETCLEGDEKLTTDISFDVVARRSETGPARTVSLPVFATIVQGGNLVVSKQMTNVTVSFAEGQARAIGSGGVRTNVARSATALSPELQAKINRKRKPTDPDAAVDPLADPQVRAALRAASFEVLLGFQLDDAGLAYNVTK
ncbi:hypothetical protein [Polymorphobacter fuscus]|nr:hypothetical protein [Polymorphobacter fuscus]NJC07676.1 hypothetical protein [Polymorphobacter fuscus]